MPAKTKKLKTSVNTVAPSLTVLLAFTVILLTITLWLLSAKGLNDSSLTRGTLDATVSYVGKDCPKNAKNNTTPPCSGPYENYLVRIFDANTDKVKAAFLSDKLGKVLMNLQVGNYYWLGRNDKNGKPVRVDFSIQPDSRTYENFVVEQTAR